MHDDMGGMAGFDWKTARYEAENLVVKRLTAECTALRTALAAQPAPDASMVLVPVEPTVEMQSAWHAAGEYWRSAYAAMIAAAPIAQQPAPDAGPVALQHVTTPTLKEAAQAALKQWFEKPWSRYTLQERMLDLKTALDAPIAPPAPDAGPVAWIDKHGNIDRGLDALLAPDGWMPLDAATIAQQAAQLPGLTALHERGAVAWAGVDAQELREGGQAAPARAELESLRKDAERWRKLRDTPATSVAPGPMRGWLFMRPASAESIDRMADELPAAAMAKDAP